MNSPKLSERCPSSLSNGRKLLNNDSKEDSLDNSVRESLKSERNGKNEEDWRRRTIIVEKKNGSYGFTLQSYGIHYKKEQEIEVITYVDHVEAEGPAALAGMREGDVILSINGTDVERADHTAIVEAISACDSRMRIVVIFEDCVRKVELHLKYINIQRAIQAKMRELDQLTVRERQLFDTNWKTHSLPSQKKKNSPVDAISDAEDNTGDSMNTSYCRPRPTLSSENVTAKPPQPVFMYQYLDPRYGTCVIQPNIRTGSFVITVGSPRNRRDCHHYVLKTPGDCHRATDNNEYKSPNGKHTKVQRSSHSHSCSTCLPNYNNQDNSLETYDYVSPCCDPHCVPNSRKKVRRKKECSKEHKKKEKCQQSSKSTQKHENCSHSRSKKPCATGHCSSRYKYLTTESTQTSQCSLQSYGVNNASAACENSASSYSTSLSSDTLFWDNDRSETKSSPKIQYQSMHQQVKPKSWDNLTTKAFGGYGFGYGYLDTTSKQSSRSKSHGRNHSSGRSTTQSHHEYSQSHEKHTHRHTSAPVHYGGGYGRGHAPCPPTKSTESLILVPKYQIETSGSETRLSCDCAESVEYYRRISASKSPGDSRSLGYYSQHFIYPTHAYNKKKDANVSSEITRL